MPREGGSSLGLLLLESQNLSGSRVGLLQAVGSPGTPPPKGALDSGAFASCALDFFTPGTDGGGGVGGEA